MARRWMTAAFALTCALAVVADDPPSPPAPPQGPPDGGPRGGGFPFPFGGPPGGGPGGGQRKLVEKYDTNGDGRLDRTERQAARVDFAKQPRRGPGGRGPGGPGGPPGMGGGEKPSPGPKLSPGDVPTYPNVPLYDPNTLRTLFLQFEASDWEAELADFYHSDVEVPATLTVDGKAYPNVGVHFRGASSYFTVAAGSKRSLNLSLDFVDGKQRLGGYKTLNLLNGHDDPSLMSTFLYSHVAGKYIPTPKANFVRVVINGECWGVYTNVQQFNKEFLAEHYKTTKGARWKVRGSPMGGGGLDYLGDNAEPYKRKYEIKSNDDEASWAALIAVCKTLKDTPTDELETKLPTILDVEGLLWFLALDNALVNCDGYWIRASDYSLYRDPAGKFHVIPHDMNEAFRSPQGPGMGGGPFGMGGPRGGGDGGRRNADLDPLVGLTDAKKPLRSKVLAVPAWRAKYLDHVRAIARDQLAWDKLGPTVAKARALLEPEVEKDTKKLDSLDQFRKLTGPDGGTFGRSTSLRAFAEGRSKYLIEYKEK